MSFLQQVSSKLPKCLTFIASASYNFQAFSNFNYFNFFFFLDVNPTVYLYFLAKRRNMTSTKRLQRKNAVSFIFFGYWEKFYYFFILSFQKQGHKIIIRTVSWYEAHLQNHLLCQGDRDIFVIFEISVVALIC